jgi:hypothetical protein
MASDIDKLKKQLKDLLLAGHYLYMAMIDDIQGLPDDFKEKLKSQGVKLPKFKSEYDTWYSEALSVVKQMLPDRTEDFIKQYKIERRKDLDSLTYGISDYLLGIQTSRGTTIIADGKSAIPKMEMQNSILKAVEKRFESDLYDIQDVLQADIFDSELDAARELSKKGFVRGAGAIAGVVLEKHLGHICSVHGLKSRKKHPSISDFYQLLKENNIIDTPKWRFIQHLGDIRNLCDHSKDRDPTKNDVIELVEGVEKVIKTVF